MVTSVFPPQLYSCGSVHKKDLTPGKVGDILYVVLFLQQRSLTSTSSDTDWPSQDEAVDTRQQSI